MLANPDESDPLKFQIETLTLRDVTAVLPRNEFKITPLAALHIARQHLQRVQPVEAIGSPASRRRMAATQIELGRGILGEMYDSDTDMDEGDDCRCENCGASVLGTRNGKRLCRKCLEQQQAHATTAAATAPSGSEDNPFDRKCAIDGRPFASDSRACARLPSDAVVLVISV